MQHLYRHFNDQKQLLYVGVSLSAITRLSQHKTHSGWFNDIASITIENFETREDVLIAETTAIQTEQPLHNIQKKIPPKKKKRATTPHIEKTTKALYNHLTVIRPMYTLQDAADLLTVPKSHIERFMRKNQLGYIQIGIRRDKRYPDKPLYRISGWQIIAFIEYMEIKNKTKI